MPRQAWGRQVAPRRCSHLRFSPAHTHIVQVLNLLAPIQASKGDRAGAEQMLTSSTTLAKVMRRP